MAKLAPPVPESFRLGGKPLTKETVRKTIDVYIKAWQERDPDLIVTIFTADATYTERVFEEPHRGTEGIRAYWVSKVVGEQSNIHCELLNLYLDGNVATAEWEAEFDTPGGRKRMREVAILEFRGERIASLREYWSSVTIG